MEEDKKIKRGKFIVFEGISGCGKGVQMSLAMKLLLDNDTNDVYVTRMPKLKRSSNIQEQMNLLEDVVNKTKEKVENEIKPMLEKGTHVLCKGYKHGTIIQAYIYGINAIKLYNLYENLLIPDITIVLDCPVKVSLKRKASQSLIGCLHRDELELKRLRSNYLLIQDAFQSKGENIVVVNSDCEINKIYSNVSSNIMKMLRTEMTF